MRVQSKKQVKVKNTLIGGPMPLICLPMVAGDRDDLLTQARELILLKPDLLEWRIDGYEKVCNIQDCVKALEDLQEIIDPIPMIFTCRIECEGGLQPISEQERLDLILGAMETGLIDIVDIELCSGKEFIDSVVKAGRASDTRVILSCHDFKKTPPRDFILDKLTEAKEMGADIAKLAAMPNEYKDVLSLMEATLAARGRVDIPLVTMSMGEKGVVSRISGGVFGSDITFAVGKNVSAPGQIPIKDLRQAMSVLY
ncbi:type I 3-dehydroquinate dehydratase [Desulfospira joergensenii]|uniref:type I 3-dehydroquinate dehydratase n=1 Tax=Desulfospira joergensenii TaxID=53329 RepID=UPI0003B5D6F8|nr:type I 3-dehydroquinate dehydratase [Desulfospira joergensenii]